jgi:transcription factor C subunit 7
MIAIGRVLTGNMPEDETVEDFKCFTASLSKFVRRSTNDSGGGDGEAFAAVRGTWNPDKAEDVPDVKWRGGVGVGGGWECEVNGDCSFLSGGEERGW